MGLKIKLPGEGIFGTIHLRMHAIKRHSEMQTVDLEIAQVSKPYNE